MKIARGVAQKHNFRNYSYINDMISNAVLTCVKNVACFDPSRGTSAFAYFTQCVWFCFLGEINKEKKEMMKKREIFLSGNFDSFDVSEEDADYVMQYNDYIRSMS
jgi:DNA-directed RNA polymerase specialized sigma subunit